MSNNSKLRKALLEILVEWEDDIGIDEVAYLNADSTAPLQLMKSIGEVQSKVAFSVKELSNYLGVSPDSIYAMVREQQIPYIRIRRRILFHKDSIDTWMKS